MDQTINYRVNIDDNNFQAKLTQMRASMDQTFMGSQMLGGGGAFGGGGYGGGGGYSTAYTMAMLNPANTGGGYGGGFLSPSSYTPPGIAFTPHYGMNIIRQTFSQSVAGSMGIPSVNPLTSQTLPPQYTPMDYASLSQKNLAARVGDAATTGVTTAATMGAGLAGMAVGEYVGAGIGAGIGTAILPGFGTAAGGVVGGFLGAVVGSSVGESTMTRPVEHAMTRRAVQTELLQSTQGLITGGPDVDVLSGRGISVKAAREEARNLELASTEKGQVYNFKEMADIQTQGMRSGLFSHAQTQADILSTTKDLAESVKTLSPTMHMSRTEAVEQIARLKETVGVTDQTEVRQDAIRSSILSRTSGLTVQQVNDAGFQGAAIVQGTGMDMETFRKAAEDTAAKVQLAYKSGAISEQLVAQHGGGTAGLAAIGNELTAANASAQQSNVGQMDKLALFDPKTGGLIKNAKEILDTASPEKLAAMASRNASSPATLMAFNRQKEDLFKGHDDITEALAQNQMRSGAQMIMRATGSKNLEDAEYTYATTSMGLSDVKAKALLAISGEKEKTAFDQKQAVSKDYEERSQQSQAAAWATSAKVVLNPIAHMWDKASGGIVSGIQGAVEDETQSIMTRAQSFITRQKLKMVSPDDMARIHEDTHPGGASVSPEHRAAADAVINDAVQKTRDKVDNAANPRTATASAPMGGATPVQTPGGSSMGDVATATMDQISRMAKTLESSYQTLLNYAKQLEQTSGKH